MVPIIRLHAPGGPEALVAERIALPPPGPGEVRLRHAAAGVNFVDVYHRAGLYPLPGLPAILGVEGAGVVEAVGPGVADVGLGDRVAWAGLPTGGYAAARNIPAARLLPLPDGLSCETAGSTLLRGLTAHMVLRRVAPVGPGQTMLIHAAAGGLGLILAQWAKRLGATVIGTVGSPEKAELAAAHGADHVIVTASEDFVATSRRLTDGRGVDVVVDGIGGETLRRGLDALRPLGVLVSLGQAGGPLPALDIAELYPRGLALARPSVFAYCADGATYRTAAAEVLALLADGLTVTIGARFPLAEAAQAHRALEGRRTSGSIVLLPGDHACSS